MNTLVLLVLLVLLTTYQTLSDFLELISHLLLPKIIVPTQTLNLNSILKPLNLGEHSYLTHARGESGAL